MGDNPELSGHEGVSAGDGGEDIPELAQQAVLQVSEEIPEGWLHFVFFGHS